MILAALARLAAWVGARCTAITRAHDRRRWRAAMLDRLRNL